MIIEPKCSRQQELASWYCARSEMPFPVTDTSCEVAGLRLPQSKPSFKLEDWHELSV